MPLKRKYLIIITVPLILLVLVLGCAKSKQNLKTLLPEQVYPLSKETIETIQAL